MADGKEQIPFFGSRTAPEFSSHLHFGSIQLLIDDPRDFIEFAAAQEQGAHTYLFRQRFEHAELGSVKYADLSLNRDEDSRITLQSTIEHTRPIQSPSAFSSKYIMALIRKTNITSPAITSAFSNRYVDAYAIETEHGAIFAETVKQAAGLPFTQRESRRNTLRLLTEISASTDPTHLMDMLQIWGSSLDILSVSRLSQRKPALREPTTVDLRSLSGSMQNLQIVMQLEQYNQNVLQANGEITLPSIDFEALDLRFITKEVAGDTDMLSAAIAACALKGIRIYGKTGIMPAITTQSLTDSLSRVRSAAEY